MKKILVTGGAGYIGSHTVVELINSGYEPIIVDNFSNSEQRIIDGIEKIVGKKVTLHIGDCGNYAFINGIFEAEREIVGVIHFAAYKAVGESVSQPLKYYDNNVGSLIVLMKVMSQHNISNMVFSSSCTVYGEPETLPVTEVSPRLEANSPYGNTKQVCEDIIKDVTQGKNNGMKAVSLRYFNPIGAHATGDIGELPLGAPNNLVPFVTQTAAGLREQVIIFGNDYDTPDGTCVRDYIHVVDLAKAHVQTIHYLLGKEEEGFYDTFNIGAGVGNSVLEVIQTFEKVSDVKLNYSIGQRRMGDVEQVYGDVSKAKELLDWESTLTLSDALLDAWRWQKNIKTSI